MHALSQAGNKTFLCLARIAGQDVGQPIQPVCAFGDYLAVTCLCRAITRNLDLGPCCSEKIHAMWKCISAARYPGLAEVLYFLKSIGSIWQRHSRRSSTL